MKKFYIGGSLFTDKQIKQRVEEEKILKENLNNIQIYNPITNDEINDKTKQPTAKDIFLQDTKKVIESDIITADLDDIDTGLAMELGVAYGINYMLEKLKKIRSDVSSYDYDLNLSIEELLKQIPKKQIYAICSDIRQDTKNENGKYKSWGQNQYIVGGIEEIGKIYRHFENILNDFKEGDK